MELIPLYFSFNDAQEDLKNNVEHIVVEEYRNLETKNNIKDHPIQYDLLEVNNKLEPIDLRSYKFIYRSKQKIKQLIIPTTKGVKLKWV